MRLGSAEESAKGTVEARATSAGRTALIVLVAAVSGGLVVALAAAAGPIASGPVEQRVATGWLPRWATERALASIEANDDLFGAASPSWYSARATAGGVTVTTSVSSASRRTVLAGLGARGVAVVPSVSDASRAREMAAIVRSPSARSAHVAQLTQLVLENGYAGIELNYERFAFSDGRSTWSRHGRVGSPS